MIAQVELTTSQASTAADRGAHLDEFLLAELTQLWQAHHRRGLEVRHQTGVLLNNHFGQPTERQAYGEATLKHCSASLGVAESDLSRMRWFAHHFESVEDLSNKHPTVTTWTKVKELLASLRQPEAKPVSKVEEDEKKSLAERTVRPVIKAMRAIQKEARGVGQLAHGSDDWRAMSEAVTKMLKTVGTCLGGHFHFEANPQPGNGSAAVQVSASNISRVPARVERPVRG
jgi:hypothetical protein